MKKYSQPTTSIVEIKIENLLLTESVKLDKFKELESNTVSDGMSDGFLSRQSNGFWDDEE